MKKAAVKRVKKVAIPYKASINILGKTYTATGATSIEAITNLKPGNCKGRGVLTLAYGTFKKERILMPLVAFRLFNSMGITREIAIKQASLLFGI